MAKILLVNGAWHGVWCWSNFAERLAGQGHEPVPVALRKHDHEPGRIFSRLHHYVDDLHRAVQQHRGPDPVVVVGHSLGGFIVQHYLQRNELDGVVLLGSVPPGGAGGLFMRLVTQRTGTLASSFAQVSLQPFVADPENVRRGFFTSTTPQQTVDHARAHLQDESVLAVLDSVLRPIRAPRTETPVLVLGARDDAMITAEEVLRTASVYGTQAEFFAGMGHDLMLDVGWEEVADRIGLWVKGIEKPRDRLPLP